MDIYYNGRIITLNWRKVIRHQNHLKNCKVENLVLVNEFEEKIISENWFYFQDPIAWPDKEPITRDEAIRFSKSLLTGKATMRFLSKFSEGNLKLEYRQIKLEGSFHGQKTNSLPHLKQGNIVKSTLKIGDLILDEGKEWEVVHNNLTRGDLRTPSALFFVMVKRA